MNPLVFTGDGPSSLTLGLIGIACLGIYRSPRWIRAWLAGRRRRWLVVALAARRATHRRRAA